MNTSTFHNVKTKDANAYKLYTVSIYTHNLCYLSSINVCHTFSIWIKNFLKKIEITPSDRRKLNNLKKELNAVTSLFPISHCICRGHDTAMRTIIQDIQAKCLFFQFSLAIDAHFIQHCIHFSPPHSYIIIDSILAVPVFVQYPQTLQTCMSF